MHTRGVGAQQGGVALGGNVQQGQRPAGAAHSQAQPVGRQRQPCSRRSTVSGVGLQEDLHLAMRSARRLHAACSRCNSHPLLCTLALACPPVTAPSCPASMYASCRSLPHRRSNPSADPVAQKPACTASACSAPACAAWTPSTARASRLTVYSAPAEGSQGKRRFRVTICLGGGCDAALHCAAAQRPRLLLPPPAPSLTRGSARQQAARPQRPLRQRRLEGQRGEHIAHAGRPGGG